MNRYWIDYKLIICYMFELMKFVFGLGYFKGMCKNIYWRILSIYVY